MIEPLFWSNKFFNEMAIAAYVDGNDSGPRQVLPVFREWDSAWKTHTLEMCPHLYPLLDPPGTCRQICGRLWGRPVKCPQRDHNRQ